MLFEADNVKEFAEINRHSNSDSLTGELCSLPSKVIRTNATFNAKGNRLTATSNEATGTLRNKQTHSSEGLTLVIRRE
jgi:hypothetical protein